jgi:hypothetical protein
MYLKNPQKQRDVMTLGPPVFHHSSSFLGSLVDLPKVHFLEDFCGPDRLCDQFLFF